MPHEIVDLTRCDSVVLPEPCPSPPGYGRQSERPGAVFPEAQAGYTRHSQGILFAGLQTGSELGGWTRPHWCAEAVDDRAVLAERGQPTICPRQTLPERAAHGRITDGPAFVRLRGRWAAACRLGSRGIGLNLRTHSMLTQLKALCFLHWDDDKLIIAKLL